MSTSKIGAIIRRISETMQNRR